jgi:hypothetical protein
MPQLVIEDEKGLEEGGAVS